MKRAAKFLIFLLPLFALSAPSVRAEDDSPAAFFRAEHDRVLRLQQQSQAHPPVIVQRPTHLIRRAAPVRGFARVVPTPHSPADTVPKLENPSTVPDDSAAPINPAPSEDAPVSPAADNPAPSLAPVAVSPAPIAAAPVLAPSAAKPAEGAFSVLVIGDSLGILLGQGLTEAFADNPDVSILRKARENTGLVRDDYFDWVKGARDIASSTDKINIVVMMIGSNDRQQLRDGALSIDMRQPQWRQLYGDRVEAIVKVFRDKKIPVVWVGLPVMRSERFSADMASFNDIYQDRAIKAGAAYVDTWEAFLDDRGQFAAYGPDINGQFQKLRSGDGVHFTKAGARKLAHFVESEIHHALDDARPKIDPVIASVPVVEPPLAPTPAKPAAAPFGPLVALPAPAAPLAVVIPVKPAFGPIRPLTGPTVSPGGALATRSPFQAASSGASVVFERALVQGQPLDARPGRADDFHWPKN